MFPSAHATGPTGCLIGRARHFRGSARRDRGWAVVPDLLVRLGPIGDRDERSEPKSGVVEVMSAW